MVRSLNPLKVQFSSTSQPKPGSILHIDFMNELELKMQFSKNISNNQKFLKNQTKIKQLGTKSF